MKGTVIAVFAVLLAVAAARDCQKPDNPVGECPPVNGQTPNFLLDEYYRDVFYVCSNGRPIRMNCPPGMVFDPIKLVCNYPSSEVGASGPVGSCPKNDGLFPKYLRDGRNVSVFYVCVNGQPRRYNCDYGLVFNPVLKACLASA